MSSIERRSSVRKSIRMACVVQFPSGITINGNTRDLSLDGVNVESTATMGSGKRNLSPGDIGLLTLKFRKGGVPASIMLQCQVMHITANGFGLSVRFAELNKQELEILGRMIASGRAEVM